MNNRKETLSLKELEEKRNYCKAMSFICAQRKEFKLSLFYSSARLGFDMRIHELAAKEAE